LCCQLVKSDKVELDDIVDIAADAEDPDGTITWVEFFADGLKIGETGEFPYTLAWLPPAIGSYSLTALATDDSGNSSNSAPVDITVEEDTPGGGGDTVTLQQGVDGYSGTSDAYVYDFFGNANYGARTTLRDRRARWGGLFRSFLRFSIFQSEGGPVPDGATILSASLGLYKSKVYDHVYRMHPLLVDWQESEVSWNSSGNGVAWASPGAQASGIDYGSTEDAEASTPWGIGWVEFDIAQGVQAIADGRANYGWVLHSVSGNGNNKVFYSSEYDNDPSLRPRLTIEYSY
ncbi:MAG: DNRLRE domain-containing protein, partial [Parahaliea sp.]